MVQGEAWLLRGGQGWLPCPRCPCTSQPGMPRMIVPRVKRKRGTVRVATGWPSMSGFLVF